MSFQPKEPRNPKKVTTTRLVLWIAAAGLAIYWIILGIIGVVQHG
ncbi:MAG: hypothetical protein QOI70_366 [Microbacteriaceae bacterium]|jgi:hypothetical protein|nr:hypothetical protein [Microbacteriaceae bacterium]